MIKSILILSPLLPTTGNTSTVNRLKEHFVREKIHVLLCCAFELTKEKSKCAVTQLNDVIRENSINGLLLLHAVKSGSCVLCTCHKSCKLIVKYGVIFGGTDINEDIVDNVKYEIMKQCINGASFCVSFTNNLTEIAKVYFSNALIYLQSQALPYDLYDTCYANSVGKRANENVTCARSNSKPIVFVLPCGIRCVKDPLFLVEAFLEWKKTIPKIDVRFLIIGPVNDVVYGMKFYCDFIKIVGFHSYQNNSGKTNEETFVETPHSLPLISISDCDDVMTWIAGSSGSTVQYIPALPQQKFQSYLKDGTFSAVVNTSKSEGMASILIEAMACGVPVFARDIPGNKAVVTDMENGLLFSTPEEFVEKADKMVETGDFTRSIIHKATKYVLEMHNPYEEAKFYLSLSEQLL